MITSIKLSWSPLTKSQFPVLIVFHLYWTVAESGTTQIKIRIIFWVIFNPCFSPIIKEIPYIKWSIMALSHIVYCTYIIPKVCGTCLKWSTCFKWSICMKRSPHYSPWVTVQYRFSYIVLMLVILRALHLPGYLLFCSLLVYIKSFTFTWLSFILQSIIREKNFLDSKQDEASISS